MITSPSNPKLRYVQHLARRSFRAREGRLLLEGLRLTEAAFEAGQRPAFVLLDPELERKPRAAALCAALRTEGSPVFEVETSLLREVATTQHPQGLLAVFPFPELPLPNTMDWLLLLDGLRDPGNLGSALRSADAAGVDAVVLAPGCVDWSNPKVLRSAMGAHCRLPLRTLDWPEIDRLVEGLGEDTALWLAEAGAEQAYSEVDWTAPSVLIVGGEAEGASVEGRARATGRIRIPMRAGSESLNAASAAAVLLFEARRQRDPQADAGPRA